MTLAKITRRLPVMPPLFASQKHKLGLIYMCFEYRNIGTILFLFIGFFAYSQKVPKLFLNKKITVLKDTIQLDSVSINPYKFKVLNSKGTAINPKIYTVDFAKARLIIPSKKYKKIQVQYYRYPSFITDTYSPFDKSRIAPNTHNTKKLYSLTTNKKNKELKLFDGLKTKGFISRGLSVGNNQNAVTNSELDLNLSGKLSEKISLRANIYDTNIPLQQNGYSQNITDFDRIFVEMFSKNWSIKAGDISLSGKNNYFLNFDKQITGLQVKANLSKNTEVSASGAIARGRFSAFNFVGVEANQGPYKLLTDDKNPSIVIISGSDKVFVNGILIQRGKDKQYTIDYNLAEIRFNTTYPITNNMRIRVEFQYADRNYTRFITYQTVGYKNDNFSILGEFYNENDIKSSPIQQNLTDAQKQILSQAGNDPSKMLVSSAFESDFSEDRILYKNRLLNNQSIFEYSTDKTAQLYSVNFTRVGENKGDYRLDRTIATGNIFRFVGKNQADYNPVTQLVAPSKLQVAALKSRYQPSSKTKVEAQLAYSNNDSNLFSSIDDDKNYGIATKLDWEQTIIDKKWQLKSAVNYQFVQQNFKTLQRFRSVEFNRDWNLTNTTGNQNQTGVQITLKNDKRYLLHYKISQLSFAGNFEGNRQEIQSKINLKNTDFDLQSQWLSNSSKVARGKFFRFKTTVNHHFKNKWIGGFIKLENNNQKNNTTHIFTKNSIRFKQYETYFGIGDTAKVFAKLGVNYSTNDSIKNNQFKRINNRKTLYVNSKIVQNKTADLSLYASYRLTENTFAKDEKSLNSKVIYRQRLLKNFVQWGTTYETSSGNVARQDYVYTKTEPGQGIYTWIDYNNDDKQQFNEFEIARFKDQATYLRVALPNVRYLPTQRVRWKQSLIFNASQWKNKKGFKKILSHFYNQTYLLTDNKQERNANSLYINPFSFDKNRGIERIFSLKNSLYFNRNLSNYSLIYTYGKSSNKQQYIIGNQENDTYNHQFELQHNLSKFWILNLKTALSKESLSTQNFNNRNYILDTKEFSPKLTFAYSKNHRFSFFYQFKNKVNKLGDLEKLKQQKLGATYFFADKKNNRIRANMTLFFNDFTGKTNSPVGYQMLEGLQRGHNYTWDLSFNKNINSFLRLNIIYSGRKSPETKTVHTGNIQLKAVF